MGYGENVVEIVVEVGLRKGSLGWGDEDTRWKGDKSRW